LCGRNPEDPPLFLFFSNRFGCLKSLLVSAAITIVLLVLLGWIQL
jgi:hypothetical protein